MIPKQPLIITGASGRIGRLLGLFEGAPEFAHFSVTWCGRAAIGAQIGWDMARGPAPQLPRGGILLHLAAVLPTAQPKDLIAENLRLAEALVTQDRAAPFAQVVFLSTVAVYAPQSGPIGEQQPPDPQADYGRAKLQCEERLRAAFGDRLIVLRLANLAGADALLGGNMGRTEAVIDPVAGQPEGPVRSYIGPQTLARLLGGLLEQIANRAALPPILNIAQPGAVSMGDLLRAAGISWKFGPPRPGVVARVEVDVSRLLQVLPLPALDPAAVIAELNALRGRWP